MTRNSVKICLALLVAALIWTATGYTQIGPGPQLPATSALSDQKLGSVLVYNLYASSVTNPVTQNTDFSLTNTHPTLGATVHLFFVNSANSRSADTFIALAPKQTMSFLASDFDPGITGYLVAVAVDQSTGCPVSFNHLLGDAYVKLSSGHSANLPAQAFAALYAGVLAGCTGGSTSAVLNFDGNPAASGSGYNQLPAALSINNVPSRANGNDTLLVVNRIGGSFVQGSTANALNNLFGILFDDAENPFSFTVFGSATQLRNPLSSSFPRTSPRFDGVISANRSGWMKFWSPSNLGVLGAVINRNPNLAISATAYEGGHNLHALTLNAAASLTVPVSPPTANVDLAVVISHSNSFLLNGDFNPGAPDFYTITVMNVGTKAATGSITLFDTLPGNLTLNFASGTGWSCTGAGTANVVCTNTNGLAASTNLPPLFLIVNVNAGTPASIVNTVTVSNAGDANPANDSASDNANVTNKTATTTTMMSSANPAAAGQNVTFTATIAGTGGTPGGMVRFVEGAAVLNTTTVSGGTAIFTTNLLTVGDHVIEALYSGDATFGDSRSFVNQRINLVTQTATTTGLASSVNPSLVGQTVNLTATVTAGATGTVQFFDGAVSLGTRTLSAGSAVLQISSLLAGGHTLTAQYLGDPSFQGSTSAPLTQTVNQSDQGLAYPATAEFSDQKTGAVLIYNLYTSSATNPATTNTDFSITNTSTATSATVHLFFVNSANSRSADTFISLTPNQTMSFLASDFDPGITGYLVAVAVDAISGCPTGFNNLAGNAYVKFASGHHAALPAQAVTAQFAGVLTGCSGASTSAVLNFNGNASNGYNLLPRALALNNIPSRAEGNDTMLIVNRIGGSFVQGSAASSLANIFGILFDDAENPFSFTVGTSSAQLRGSLSDTFPRLSPRFSNLIPAGRSGFMKLWSPSDFGLTGSFINFNASAGSSAAAFNRGTNLPALTFSGAPTLTIPVSPPTANVDLTVGISHAGFNVGTTGVYNVTVTNVGTKAATGTITLFDTLPNNLTFASFGSTVNSGWSCSGTGTANVVCTNTNGLAASASLPTLTLFVNVNSAIPANISNTVTVSNAGDNLPGNDSATDNATVTSLMPTTTALVSSANPSSVGQNVTFTATVTGTGGPPTGTVNFLIDGSLVGSPTLVGGVATFATSSLTAGTHSVAAFYSGDATFAAPVSVVALQQNVNLSPRFNTTTALVSGTNPSTLGQSVTFTATVTSAGGPTPTGNVEFFDGATSLGVRGLTAGATTLTTSSLLAGNHSLTAQYLGDTSNSPSTSNTVAQTVNQVDAGLAYPASAENSDQKTGSVLVYNIFSSDSTAPNAQNTDISITNTSTATAATVHLFFVRGSSGVSADTFVTLPTNRTLSFLASNFDPGTTGYLVAVAVDGATGCPVSFNNLAGNAYVKFSTGHRAALPAQAFSALYSGTLAGCSGLSPTAVLNFDGAVTGYNQLPFTLSTNGISSRANGNDTLLVLNRIGGNLSFGAAAATVGALAGTLFNDIETGFSWNTTANVTQFRIALSNSFPLANFDTIIPSGRSGWMKFPTGGTGGMVGALINRNPSAASSALAYNYGTNLTELTLAAASALTIPVYASTFGADLTIGKTHSGNFAVGSTGNYTITVGNAGPKSINGTVTVTDTLPNALTLASFAGTGWSCTGLGLANVVCTNTSGLAASTNLPALTLTVNVNPGTPVGTIGNTATVAVFPDQEINPGNNSATDATTVVCGPITLNPTTLPPGAGTIPYNQTLTATGGTAPYTFSVVGGALPSGLMLLPTGVISGAPTALGLFNFNVLATDAQGCSGTRNYAVTVNCGFTLTPKNEYFLTAGGPNTINVATLPTCMWTATSNAPWLTITSGANGTGNGTVGYTAAPNPDPQPRTGTMAVAGNTFTVTEAAGGGLINENFDNGIPTDWTVIDGGSGGGAASTWTTANPCNRMIPAPFSGNFAIVDATCAGPTAVLDEQLITPSFDATGLGALYVEFFNQFQWTSATAGNTGDVDIRIGGGPWVNVLRLQNGDDGVPPNTKTINLTPFLKGNVTDVQLRMHYYGNGAPARPNAPTGEQFAYWAVDYSIFGYALNPTMGAGGATVAITGTNFNSVTGVKFNNNVTAQFTIVNATTITATVPPGAITGPITLSRTGLADVQTGVFTVAGTGLQFYPLPRPLRLLDTRPDQSLCDNIGTPITGGTALTTQARITCNGLTIPANAQAIVGNVTVINQTASFGFLTLFPAGQQLPLAANIIYEPGQLLSNNFTVGLNANGEFSTFAERTLHTVIDVSGYFAPPTPTGLFYHALPRPLRLLDTRADQSLCDTVGLPITGGTALTTQARISCNGLTIPTAAQAIVGNATVINQTEQFGFMTLFPSGQTLPLAANMIYAPGQLLSNYFTVGLSAGGQFDTFAERTLHLVIDVAGYYSTEANDANGPGLLFNPLPRPLRLLDTRPDQSLCDNIGAPIAAGTSLTTQARISCNGITIPAAAQAVNGNITVINQTASFGFLTLFPAGQTLPLAANMIYAPGQLLSNAFVVGLSGVGEFNTFGERTIHVVIDVSGYFAP